MVVKDPNRLYGPDSSEEEFLNGVGVHETTHALNDVQTLAEKIGDLVDKTLKTMKGKEKQTYKLVEIKPDKKEDKSRTEYKKKTTKARF